MAIRVGPERLRELRDCLAALAIQGVEDVGVRLRVGLQSGQVIVGEIGSGPGGYTAVGERSEWLSEWSRSLRRLGDAP